MEDMNNNLNNNNNGNELKPQRTSLGSLIIAILVVAAILAIIKGTTDLYEKATGIVDDIGKIENNISNLGGAIVGDNNPNGDNNTGLPAVDDENLNQPEPIDPYAKYTNIKWAGKEDTVKNIKLYIENGAVYSKDTENGTTHKWTTIGTPKRIMLDPPAVVAVMVTEEGKVYDISYDSCTQVLELNKYNIVDMAYLDNYTYEHFYFLTSDGNLIDRNGVPYEKYGFVGKIEYGKMWSMPLDKYNYGYHWNNEKDVYEVITNSSKSKLAFSKVYFFNEYMLIQTSHGKLFKYEYSSVAKQESESFVSRIERKGSGENTSLVVTFMDLSTKEYKNVEYAYDVSKKKEIAIESMTKYVEQPKIEVPDLSDAIEELEKISNQLQRFIIAAYDAKTITGAEVLACFQQYQNSDFSIIVITNEKGTAYTGKYKLNENNLKVSNLTGAPVAKEHKAYTGGVYYMGSALAFDTNTKRTQFTELQGEFGVNAAQTYYSSIIKDKDGNPCGVVFMQR